MKNLVDGLRIALFFVPSILGFIITPILWRWSQLLMPVAKTLCDGGDCLSSLIVALFAVISEALTVLVLIGSLIWTWTVFEEIIVPWSRSLIRQQQPRRSR